MKCSLCGEPGHNARGCPKKTGGGVAPATRKVAVGPKDLPSVKAAVIGVVEALEGVAPEDRRRVMQGAALIL